MDRYMIVFSLGFVIFMAFVSWCIITVMKMANDEDPGCIDPRSH